MNALRTLLTLRLPRLPLLAAASLASAGALLAADSPLVETKPAKEASIKEAPAPPAWNVRVEVMMVSVPQEMAVAILPDLRAADKIAAAVTKLNEAITRKEATLTGYPIVQVLDGQRTLNESIFEKRYPVEFQPPATDELLAAMKKATTGEAPPATGTPTAFETRNTGATLEAEPRVLDDGTRISVTLTAQRVASLGMDTVQILKKGDLKPAQYEQPKFFTLKTSSSIIVKNGAWSLLAVHKLPEPEAGVELMLLQASVTPTK